MTRRLAIAARLILVAASLGWLSWTTTSQSQAALSAPAETSVRWSAGAEALIAPVKALDTLFKRAPHYDSGVHRKEVALDLTPYARGTIGLAGLLALFELSLLVPKRSGVSRDTD